MRGRHGRGRRLTLRRAVGAAAWLLLFLGALGLVIWRQTEGVARERSIHQLQSERALAEAERVQLERRILSLSTRARVVRLARERLGLQVPADTQIVFLPLPAAADPGAAAQAGGEP